MSDRSHALPAPQGEYVETSRFGGLSILCVVIFVAGVVAAAVSGGSYNSTRI